MQGFGISLTENYSNVGKCTLKYDSKADIP